MFEQWLNDLTPHAPYVILLGVILLSGMGLPLPEDIPIIVGGYLAGTGVVEPWTMLPALFAAVLGADGIVFFLGRRYGHHVPRLPLLRRYLTEKRLARTELELNRHGGKFIFAARFLPGLRAPAMFTAGIFKVPYWKFLLYDGSAAAISVPVIFLLAYYFAEDLEAVRKWVSEGSLGAAVAVVLAIVVFFVCKALFARRMARSAAGKPVHT